MAVAPSGEEAALRAKIQAMKNLLHVKQQQQQQPSNSYRSAHYPHHHYTRTFPPSYRTAPHTTTPVTANRSWNRFSSTSGSATSNSNAVVNYRAPVASANKVWRKEDAAAAESNSSQSVSATPVAVPRPAMISKAWKPSVRIKSALHTRLFALSDVSSSLRFGQLKVSAASRPSASSYQSLLVKYVNLLLYSLLTRMKPKH